MSPSRFDKGTSGVPEPDPSQDGDPSGLSPQDRLADLTAQLRALPKDDPARQDIIAQMRPIRAEIKRLRPKPEGKIDKSKMTREKAKALVASLDAHPDYLPEDKKVFKLHLRILPPYHQARFLIRMEQAMKQPDEATRITTLRGINFEMTRMAITQRQGLEQTNFSGSMPPAKVDYTGFGKAETTFQNPPTNKVKGSPIDFDVPLMRGDQTYVYETKSNTRKPYGEKVQARNQLLKYQTAIEEGSVAGATIELRGRLDLAFLGWAVGETIDDPGSVPDVELIYTVPLPSGKEYRFVLKRSESGRGLHFQNEERYAEDDLAVIRGIQKSLVDKSVIGIVSGVHISEEVSHQAREQYFTEPAVDTESVLRNLGELLGYDPNDVEERSRVLRRFFSIRGKKKLMFDNDAIITKFSELLGIDVAIQPEQAIKDLWTYCMSNPPKIASRRLYEIYDTARNKSVMEQFAERRGVINDKNEKSAVSEYATPEFIERSIRQYQEYLAQNPEVAAVKGQYILAEELIPRAVDMTMAMLEKIADHESARADSPEEEERRMIRSAMGYSGRPEGVALDIEHIWIDVIYSINNAGLERAATKHKSVKSHFDLFFTEMEGNAKKVELKFETMDDFDAAINSDIELARHWASLTSNQREQLRSHIDDLVKRNEFVRSYDWPERFITAEDLPDHFEGADRRYMEMVVQDQKTGKFIRHTDTNEPAVEDERTNIMRENVKRARDYITALHETDPRRAAGMARNFSRRLGQLSDEFMQIKKERGSRMGAAQGEARQQSKQYGTQDKELQKERKGMLQKLRRATTIDEITQIRGEIDRVDLQRSKLKEQGRVAFTAIQEISAEYKPQEIALYQELSQIYQQIIPEAEWKTFALREVELIDQNIMKMIYAATSDGVIIVQEEIFRGSVTGRAAHSELAQGRNTYGAGELAFQKIGGTWTLTEVNNGSGHYRPDAVPTVTYVRNLLQQQGVDVSRAKITDCILRGRNLRNATAF